TSTIDVSNRLRVAFVIKSSRQSGGELESRPDYEDWQKEHQSAGEPSINLYNTMFSGEEEPSGKKFEKGTAVRSD
ncbi:28432_t:CDS:2, partial [Dentiscutata erythropus]